MPEEGERGFAESSREAFSAIKQQPINRNKDRDPTRVNTYLAVAFEDVIAEPEGIRTIEPVWNVSQTLFNFSKSGCYLLCTILTAPCIAFCCGCSFACISWQHIWCWGPAIRKCRINLHVVRKVLRMCLGAICGPCLEIVGLMCSKIKVRYQKLPDGTDVVEEEILESVVVDKSTGEFRQENIYDEAAYS